MRALPHQRLPITTHLRELRRRLQWTMIVFIGGGVGLLEIAPTLYASIIAPLRNALPPNAPMVFLNAPDLFFAYLKVSFMTSLFLTSPFTFYQFWAFIAPGLLREEQKSFIGYLSGSIFLFLVGGSFAYFVVLPLVFQFFFGFSTDQIVAFPSVTHSLNLTIQLLIAFGLCFQIPVVMMLLTRIDLVDFEHVRKKRPFVIVWVFIIAALLTPPDVISQGLMAIPMLLLFELGLWLTQRMRKANAQSIPSPSSTTP